MSNSELEASSSFKFVYTTKIPLGCPVYGYDAYVVNPVEERWLRMSEQELI